MSPSSECGGRSDADVAIVESDPVTRMTPMKLYSTLISFHQGKMWDHDRFSIAGCQALKEKKEGEIYLATTANPLIESIFSKPI